MKVLLVEDSKRLQRAIGTGFKKEGFAIDIAGDGEEGLFMSENGNYDVIILDLMLPGMDGLSILERLRNHGLKTHIIILTARHTVEERVKGLSLGADDYLTKPFAYEELLARVQALIRRKFNDKNPTLQMGSLEVNTSTRSVRRGGVGIDLAPREYKLLEYLLYRRGQLVTRTELEEHIYDERVNPMSNVVDAAVCKLRKKVNVQGQPNLIHTLRGSGYIMEEQGA